MKQLLAYSLKCWFASILVGTTAVCMYAVFNRELHHTGQFPSGLLDFVTYLLFTSFVSSIPAALTFGIYNWAFKRYAKSEYHFKIGATIAGITIWLLLIFLFSDLDIFVDFNDSLITSPYLAGLLVGIWFFKVDFISTEEETNHDDILDRPI